VKAKATYPVLGHIAALEQDASDDLALALFFLDLFLVHRLATATADDALAAINGTILCTTL
jgi:hypothetical protein